MPVMVAQAGGIEPIEIRTEDGLTLQAEVRMPAGPARAAAVTCHPHPEHGGSKDHPLLWAIRNQLAGGGFAVVAFNFRGIMGSGGEYGGGVDEIADVRAAVAAAGDRGGESGGVFLCGWSFGANVALREALQDDRVGAVALIGFPLGESSLDLPPLPPRDTLRAYARPVLLISGEGDQFSPIPDLRALGRRLPRSTVQVIPGTGHFFERREGEIAAMVGRFAEAALFD
jgi:alpha/beta superfamily hydrolase